MGGKAEHVHIPLYRSPWEIALLGSPIDQYTCSAITPFNCSPLWMSLGQESGAQQLDLLFRSKGSKL